jgi:glutathione-regulated potassium-efflux system ancillary protein KefF
MVLVLYAHPYPDRSRANRALVEALGGLEGVRVRSLYELYPDFHIDARAEQAAVERTRTIVLQHPLYWYSPPAIMAMWFEKVLLHGWAFGAGGTALRGKRCLWVVTTGSPGELYSPQGVHGMSFEACEVTLRSTAVLCGMQWLSPMIVHDARTMPRADLDAVASRYRERLSALAAEDAREREATAGE